MKSKIGFVQFIFLILFLLAAGVRAQTNSFTYQGRLTDGATAANGSYDLQFSLFDAGGAQIGSTATISAVTVTNGIFTVQLDFGANAFPGAERFLEIAVKKPIESNFTTLTPRQPITSAPYAIKSATAETANISIDSTQLGGVAANQFVQTTDARLTDDRNPTSGSGFYIQNSTTPQSASNFNLSGSGTANSFNALVQYNLNGNRLLAAPAGTQNTFTGINAGNLTTGNFNSFFGNLAGAQNTSGGGNSFFGTDAGLFNTTGITNSFFGRSAGRANSTGSGNSLFGVSTGAETTTGNGNTFLGSTAGITNTTGNNNTLIGSLTNVGANNLNFAAAIGSGAVVTTSNTIVFGRSNGFDTVEIPGSARAKMFSAATEFQINGSRIIGVGGELLGSLTSLFIGLNAGTSNTAGIGNTFVGRGAGFANTDGDFNSFFGFSAGPQNTTAGNNSFFGYQAGLSNTTGGNNSYFGWRSGNANVDGERNAFFGAESGNVNTTGAGNSFFGYTSGLRNTTGGLNSFFGHLAGLNNRTGSYNSFFGHFTGQTPQNSTRVTLLGSFSDALDNLDFATAIGAHAVVTTSNTIVLGRPNGADKVVIPGLGDGGDLQLCWNASLQIARCVSSLRFKTDVKPFNSGLSLVKRLQPITFNWTTNGKNDLGLGAETVAEIEPLLVTYNEEGRIEGVKYDRLGVVLLNAVKEQQAQIENQEKQNGKLKTLIEQQQKQIEEQKILIEGLRAIVCAQNPQALICQSKEEKPR